MFGQAIKDVRTQWQAANFVERCQAVSSLTSVLAIFFVLVQSLENASALRLTQRQIDLASEQSGPTSLPRVAVTEIMMLKDASDQGPPPTFLVRYKNVGSSRAEELEIHAYITANEVTHEASDSYQQFFPGQKENLRITEFDNWVLEQTEAGMIKPKVIVRSSFRTTSEGLSDPKHLQCATYTYDVDTKAFVDAGACDHK